MVSVVIPCFRSEATIAKVVETTIGVFEGDGITDYEFILVNDCSGQATYDEITRLAKRYDSVTGLNLAANVGQQMALFAGMRLAKGDVVVTMDDDMQTHPTEALKLLHEIEKGDSEFVIARYEQLEEEGKRKLASKLSSRITPMLTGRPRGLYVGSFYAITSRVRNEIVSYSGLGVNIQALAFKIAKNPVNVIVQHHEREAGASGYTFAKLIRAWKTLLSYSDITERLAFMCTVLSGLLFAVFLIVALVCQSLPWATIAFVSLSNVGIFCVLSLLSTQVTQILFCNTHLPQYSISESTLKEASAVNAKEN